MLSAEKPSPFADRPVKVKSKKRKLYELHSWLGFHLIFIMSIVLLTGTIAVIADEIDWLLRDEMRVVPDDKKVSWGEMETAVRLAAPEHLLASITAGEGDYLAYRARMIRSDKSHYLLNINPWSGEVTGVTHALTVQRFVRDLHRYLFMPNWVGLPIVCSLAIVLMLSMYSGLKAIGRIRTVATRVRTGKGIRVAVGDLHRAAGIWSLWFFVVMTLTGLWYLTEFGAAVAGKRFEPDRPELTDERLLEIGDVRRLLPTNELVAKARSEIDDWEPEQIHYPLNVRQPVTVLGSTDDFFVRSRANRVFLDPVNGAVLYVQKSSEIGFFAYINEMADPLHFGSFASWLSKFVWFFFGLIMTGLSLTGFWLTCKRLKRFDVSRAQLYTLPIVMGSIVCGGFYIERYTHEDEESTLVARASEVIDKLKVKTVWREGLQSKDQFVRIVMTHADGTLVPRRAWVTAENGETYTLDVMMATSQTVLKTTFPMPPSERFNTLSMDVEMVSGSRIHQGLIREVIK